MCVLLKGNFYTFSTILIEAEKYYLLWWNYHNFSCCSNWRELENSEAGMVWLFRFIKFWATICGKNEGPSIWCSSAKFYCWSLAVNHEWEILRPPPTVPPSPPSPQLRALRCWRKLVSDISFNGAAKDIPPTITLFWISRVSVCFEPSPSFGYMCGRATAILSSQRELLW